MILTLDVVTYGVGELVSHCSTAANVIQMNEYPQSN